MRRAASFCLHYTRLRLALWWSWLAPRGAGLPICLHYIQLDPQV
jgi:hypothetical protein